ncbi:hypothetical protein [Sphingobacterium multivorum]|uniref:hypothetical protein n=1 Tax=Sphingobacterium multivorum TaxID=28454 RepID=UPI0028B190B3|nr:hypothetical protein [Sphingobacterium multivorum]
MKPLEIICRNRVLYARISVEEKGLNMHDYYLYHKNGISFYIFRKEEGIWKLVYGELDDDIREACIDALIIRFDDDVPEIFYHQGQRQIVRISSEKKLIWLVYLNERYCGRIDFNAPSMGFNYRIEHETLLTEENFKRYIHKIRHAEIKWNRSI